MSTVEIAITVDEKTALAYQEAQPHVRQAALAKAAEILRLSLMSKDALADEFDRFTARTGSHAKTKGWTDDMNEPLLRGDYDE